MNDDEQRVAATFDRVLGGTTYRFFSKPRMIDVIEPEVADRIFERFGITSGHLKKGSGFREGLRESQISCEILPGGSRPASGTHSTKKAHWALRAETHLTLVPRSA